MILEVEFHTISEEILEAIDLLDESEEVDWDLTFDYDLHHTLCGAPQRKWIARPGRNHADPETAPQRVELIGQRDDLRCAIARNVIFHALGLVLIVYRLPDGFGLALHARVKAADHSLQFGEFLYQLGGEIALR